MFDSLCSARLAVPHAPVFPPLPVEDDEAVVPGGGPSPLYCPRRTPDGLRWRTMRVGGQSIGHGPGSEGHSGTARDKGTGARGSNLTRDDGGPSGDDIKGLGNGGPDGSPLHDADDGPLLDGSRGGPAQPRRPS